MLLVIIFIAILLGLLAGCFIGYKYYHYQLKRLRKPAKRYDQSPLLLEEQSDQTIDSLIELLKVDNDTLEAHFALASLFRRRGEIERAIRIHQNIIVRSNISADEKAKALFLLAGDYFAAGVYDRAERIYLQLTTNKQYLKRSSEALIKIYQYEQEWQKVIKLATKARAALDTDAKKILANCYCELAKLAKEKGEITQAAAYLQEAQTACKHSMRVQYLLGMASLEQLQYKQAIKYFHKANQVDRHLFLTFLPDLVTCYRQLNNEAELLCYLTDQLASYEVPPLVILIAKFYLKERGVGVALSYLSEKMMQFSSLELLEFYLDVAIRYANSEYKPKFEAAWKLVTNSRAYKPKFRCQECGYEEQQHEWSCPSCFEWETIKPILQ